MRHQNPQNKYAQEAGIQLGLTIKQVQVFNFGYHTVNAIEAEMEKGVSLKDAYKKYYMLNNIEVEGMVELGLSREQVLAKNFGYHTIDAIKDIQKRSSEISLDDAFNMVEGKPSRDVNEVVKSFLSKNQKPIISLHKMNLIRVIVNPGRGFGHQRAAITLMQKLREMGFKGTFDIQCIDKLRKYLFSSTTGKRYWNRDPLVSSQLISMIPGLSNTDEEQLTDELGTVKLSSFSSDFHGNENLNLEQVNLAVSAADDFTMGKKSQAEMAIKFNADCYIGLQPTDWHQGSCFVTDEDGIVTELPPAKKMRLSSRTSYQLPDISSIMLSAIEQKVIDITNNNTINSQLVYGLYPAQVHDINGCKETGNLDEATEMQRIIDANILLSNKTGKASVLLLPQEIALDDNFVNTIKEDNDSVYFIDLSRENLDIENLEGNDIVIVYTGHLQKNVFDYLMLKGTNLPPVIEGCNSRELCESAGRAFIHGSSKNVELKRYALVNNAVNTVQELHMTASLCLKQGNPEFVPQLAEYMEKSLNANPTVTLYHKQRKGAFHRRKDACECALDALGIIYTKNFKNSSSLLSKQVLFSPYTPISTPHKIPPANNNNNTR